MTDRQRTADDRVLSEEGEIFYSLNTAMLDALKAHGEALQALGDAFAEHSEAIAALAAEYQDALVAAHEGMFDDAQPLADALSVAADAHNTFNVAFVRTTSTLEGIGTFIEAAFDAEESI